MELVIPIWAKHRSQRDVIMLLNFYQSPAGQSFIRVQGQMQQEAYEMGEKWGQLVGLRFLECVQRAVQHRVDFGG